MGDQKNSKIRSWQNGKIQTFKVDYFIPLFGLIPRLGPIKDWGLNIENNAIKVNNSLDYQTNIDGIYAIGDVNTYPGKLKLILSGFHEAAVMCHSAYSKLNPGKRNTLKYTTVSGVEGFDGSKKEAKKWSKLARLSLKEIPQSSIKNLLEEISNYIISRTS